MGFKTKCRQCDLKGILQGIKYVSRETGIDIFSQCGFCSKMRMTSLREQKMSISAELLDQISNPDFLRTSKCKSYKSSKDLVYSSILAGVINQKKGSPNSYASRPHICDRDIISKTCSISYRSSFPAETSTNSSSVWNGICCMENALGRGNDGSSVNTDSCCKFSGS